MMLRKKSSPWACLKYLYVLPLTAITITVFARPEISNELKDISLVKVNDIIGSTETKPDEKSLDQPDSLLIENSAVTFINREEEGKTTAYVQVEPMEEPPVTIRYVVSSVTTSDDAGRTQREEVTLSASQADIYIGKDKNQPLLIVDGEIRENEVLSTIPPENIYSISVLKDEHSVVEYGEKGKNGVIIVTTKAMGKSVTPEVGTTYSGTKILSVEGGLIDDILFLLDGKETKVKEVDLSKIKSVKIIKDLSKANDEEKEIIKKYGDRAKKGIIIASSKETGDNSTFKVIGIGTPK